MSDVLWAKALSNLMGPPHAFRAQGDVMVSVCCHLLTRRPEELIPKERLKCQRCLDALAREQRQRK